MKKILQIFSALLLAACGGQQDFSHQGGAAGSADFPQPMSVAGSVNPGAGGSEASEGGSQATDDPHNGGVAATPATGGSPASSGGQPTAGGGAAPEGQGGTGGELGPAGAAGSPAAGSGGTGSTCTPTSWEAACVGLSCGKASNGCGSEYVCGSCSGATECVAGACKVTCETAELECGEHHGPEGDLSCGECPQGQDCGVVGAGKCSTCKAVGPSAVCPSSTVLWRSCGEAPVADCYHPPDADPTWWCCL